MSAKRTLTAYDAIAYASAHNLTLNKYADPFEGEGAQTGLTLTEACEIARVRCSLIWVEVLPSITLDLFADEVSELIAAYKAHCVYHRPEMSDGDVADAEKLLAKLTKAGRCE